MLEIYLNLSQKKIIKNKEDLLKANPYLSIYNILIVKNDFNKSNN